MSFNNIGIDRPAAPASGPPAGPAESDPKPAPAAQVPQADADDDDLDFGFGDAPDTDDDGTGGDDEDGGAPAEISPIGPPEGANVHDWREQHGIPETADGYTPPEIEGIPWNTEALGPIADVAHKHNIPAAAFQEALAAYAEQVAETQANLKRQDSQRLAEVRNELTPAERTAIDAASRTMSRDLRSALKQARLPDGRLLLHDGEFLQLLANLSRQNATSRVGIAQTDAAREAEIRQVLRTDYEGYVRRGLDKELSAILNRKGSG